MTRKTKEELLNDRGIYKTTCKTCGQPTLKSKEPRNCIHCGSRITAGDGTKACNMFYSRLNEIHFVDVLTRKVEAIYTLKSNMNIFEFIEYLKKEKNIVVIHYVGGDTID